MQAQILAFLSNWTLFVFASGLLLAIAIALNARKSRLPNLLLSGMIFIMSYFCFVISLHFSGKIVKYDYLIGTPGQLLFLLGPFAFLYVRSLMIPDFALNRYDTVHFLPFGMHFFYFIYSSGLPLEERLVVAGTDFLSTRQFYVGLSYSFVLGYYIFMIVTEKRMFQRLIEDNFSNIETFKLQWIKVFSIILAGTWLSFLIPVFFVPKLYLGISLAIAYPTAILAIAFYAVSHSSLFEIAELYGVETQLVVNELGEVEPRFFSKHESKKDREKYQNSSLSDHKIGELSDKLLQVIEEHRPYLNANLKLQDLAKMAKTSSHNLSQAINGGLNQSFYDLINKYRIEEAKKKLANPKLDHLPILDIAYSSGFNSKSVFNTTFKKDTGMTPSEFRSTTEKIQHEFVEGSPEQTA